MYNSPYNRMIQSEINAVNQKGIQNMRNIESGYGNTGAELKRKIGGRKGRKAQMEGEGFLDFMEDFGKGFVKGFTGAADVASKVLPIALQLGLGKGQKKYKKQSENMSGCAMPMSGMAAGTFRDSGIGTQLGAVGKGKKRGRPSKKMMQGSGFFDDFVDGFTSVFDVAGKVLPSVAPFIGLGKSGGRKMTLQQLERLGSMPPEVMRDRMMNMGSTMSGFGKKRGGASKFKPIDFDMEEEDDDELADIMGRMTIAPSAPRQSTRRIARAPIQVTSVTPAKRKGELMENPRRKTRVVEGEGFSGGKGLFDDYNAKLASLLKGVKKHPPIGGRRTEEMGDFSGMGFSGGMKGRVGMGSSGGAKRQPNAWIQLVNKVRKEKGLKGVKESIAYIKQHNLYKK